MSGTDIASGFLNAGASIFGSIKAAESVQATNAQQLEMFHSNQNMMNDQYWQTRADNLQQAELTREYSNTAYRRAMTDMRAAGLNPMLAFMQGGAQSPPGANISSVGAPSAPQLQNNAAGWTSSMNALGQALGHSAQVKATLNQAAKDQSQTDLNKATTTNTDATTDLTKEATKAKTQEIATGKATEQNQNAQATAANAAAVVSAATAGLVGAQTNSARSRATIDALDAADQERNGVYRQGGWSQLGTQIMRGALNAPNTILNPPGTAASQPRFEGFGGPEFWKGWNKPINPDTPGGRFRSWIEGGKK